MPRSTWILLLVACISAPCAEPAAAALLRYDVAGRVYEVAGESELLAGVRIGDPVSGWFIYDTDWTGGPTGYDIGTLYKGPFGMSGGGIQIVSPRGGETIAVDGSWFGPGVWVFNDATECQVHFNCAEPPGVDDPRIDSVSSFQFADEIAGFGLPVVGVEFLGRRLEDESLPAALNLDDWQRSSIFLEAGDAGVYAEIGSLTLVAPRLPGDADGNGTVDLEDFNVLKTNFGQSGAWEQGDFTGDGTIDLNDFNVLKTHFGESTTVPEPAAWLLAAMTLAVLFSRRSRLPLLLAGVLLASALEAGALEFKFTYGPGFEEGTPARAALDVAAATWEELLFDSVTLRIDANWSEEMAAGVAGRSRSTALVFDYAVVRDALVADATSADDAVAVAHLPGGERLAFRTVTPEGEATTSDGDAPINRRLEVTRSGAKALGLTADDPAQIDGWITFNAKTRDTGGFAFESDSGGSFQQTAVHEIGHLLGFVSGVDVVDQTSLPFGPDAPADLTSEAVVTPLDLFRYAEASLPLSDLTPGGRPYFSLDGGATSLARLSTGAFNGNLAQASHWRDVVGVMYSAVDSYPTSRPSPFDLQALDVIGWDVHPAPEPGAWALVFSATCIAAGGRVRR